jgi:hypothetical protein
MRSYVLRIAVAGLVYSSSIGLAYAEYSVQEQLKDFHNNPEKFMNDRSRVQKYLQNYIPSKVDVFGDVVETKLSSEAELKTTPDSLPFPAEALPPQSQLGGDFVDIKNSYHEGLAEAVRPGRADYKPVDNPEIILGRGNMKLKNLKDMEKRRMTSGRVEESPWADDYWPIFSGQIAKRYYDDRYPRLEPNTNRTIDWAVFREAILNKNASSANDMSPAEKYELLVGDRNRTFSGKMVAEADGIAGTHGGKIERWMGLCHGWAPAAIAVKRPKRDIEVAAWSNGDSRSRHKIKFYPSDIKALTTYLWAKVKIPSPFMGTRCEKKNPAQDANGRILDEECFDTNPGAWHLTLINQVGLLRKSMIIDATFDYEVWNQPIYGYEYSYFNPETLEHTKSLREATIQLKDFSRDKFAKYRSKKSKKIVGVAMKLTYIAETAPNHRLSDSEDRDRKVAVNYLYDLELDDNDDIIGGEWYTNLHPDFVWIPAAGARPTSIGDEFLSRDRNKWTRKSKNSIPESWHLAALKSAKDGMPVARIVEALVERSRKHQIFGN